MNGLKLGEAERELDTVGARVILGEVEGSGDQLGEVEGAGDQLGVLEEVRVLVGTRVTDVEAVGEVLGTLVSDARGLVEAARDGLPAGRRRARQGRCRRAAREPRVLLHPRRVGRSVVELRSVAELSGAPRDGHGRAVVRVEVLCGMPQDGGGRAQALEVIQVLPHSSSRCRMTRMLGR